MNLNEFDQYQMSVETTKDAFMEENRRLTRKLAEKDQSFELVKMVHFDKSIDLRTLNDIIIGCTGCLHSLMFYHNQVITNMDKESELYQCVISQKDFLTDGDKMMVTENVIPNYTAVMYPVSTSDMLSESKRFVKHIVMLYPQKLMNQDVLDFAKSFMIVNEVLINIVLTRAKMIELIETDPMTKALNRTSWTDNLKDMLEDHLPFFVLFFDIDGFKGVNDNYGHQKGDDILKYTSDWSKSVFRGDDRVFRLGGDEFAVTGHINIEHIQGLIEKFHSLNTSFESCVLKQFGMALTISIGGLITQKKYNEKEIYQVVDDLLYQSKQNGRNTLTIATELGERV